MKRTIVAHSHSYSAASDCGLYLTRRVRELRDVRFEVEADVCHDGSVMWKLLFCADLDRVKGGIDIDFTHHIVDQARAFITGRGGLALPRENGG